MQFQEQVAQFVRRSVAWRGVALALEFIVGVPEAFVVWVFCWSVGCLPRAFWAVLAVSGSFAY